MKNKYSEYGVTVLRDEDEGHGCTSAKGMIQFETSKNKVYGHDILIFLTWFRKIAISSIRLSSSEFSIIVSHSSAIQLSLLIYSIYSSFYYFFLTLSTNILLPLPHRLLLQIHCKIEDWAETLHLFLLFTILTRQFPDLLQKLLTILTLPFLWYVLDLFLETMDEGTFFLELSLQAFVESQFFRDRFHF